VNRIAIRLLLSAAFLLVAVLWWGLVRNREGAFNSEPDVHSPAAYGHKATLPKGAAPAPSAIVAPTDQTLARERAVEGHAAITNFAVWAEDFLADNPSANPARGEALAWKRREAMRELIETDPAKAIELAAPFSWRTTLPANVTRHFEQWVDGTGSLLVYAGTDFERRKATVTREVELGGQTYQAFVYGSRRAQVSQQNIPLHGIALDGKMAVTSEPMRILEPAEAAALNEQRSQPTEAICGVSGREADYRNQQIVADVGGEVKFFCGVDHAYAVKKWMLQRLAASGGENGGYGSLASAANDAWTHGSKNVLYLRVNFPDDLTVPISEAQAYDVMDDVNLFYTEGSYNMTALSTMVTPLLTLPETKGWYSTAGPGALMSHAREAARRAGFETANYPLDIVALTPVPDYDWGGLGAVHGKSTWLQSMGAGVTAHELGHNYGLWHANFWIATNSSIGLGTNHEYGNIFDTMGNATAGNNQFNAAHKNILNWLPDPSVHPVLSNGVYRIYPFDAAKRVDGRFYAAKVTKDYEREYWLEFHERFASNPWTQFGLLLHWGPWEQSAGGTHLLDTTPGTTSRADSAITIGRTFSDTAAGVHITPLGRGATDTDPWIEVQINLVYPANNWPPFLTVEVDPTNAAPGQLVRFHATAEDYDGDTLSYAWTFDDGTFSTNNQPWAFQRWSAPGEYVVRCEVSDMKGGRASANAVVRVGQPTDFRITGIILDANDDPIEGVRVENSDTNTPNFSGFTDSDGVFVIAGVSGDMTLEAIKYGYTFTNLTWQNPINITSNTANLNILALPSPTIRISASTNSVSETNTSAHTLTLTRTGDLTEELTAMVYLSGTADVGNDFTLNPPLDALATNAIVFPTNEATVSITFQVVNDSTGEAAEGFTLTVLEDLTYFVTSPGAATVRILDNDTAAAPAVSVVSVNPTIPENAMDRGTLLFTRRGNTQNNLTVFYSASGSATPGTDYGSLPGVVLIPAGSDTTVVQFQTRDDKFLEPDEIVSVSLVSNPAYSISGSAAEIEITDDDLLTVTIFPTGANAAEPTTSGTFTVKRDGDLTGNLVVFYSVSGSATSGEDFTPFSGAVTIPADANSADIILSPLEDTLLEGDESVTLTLTTNLSYSIGTPGVATLLIRDNEKTTVTITASDDEATEPGEDIGRFQISRGSVVNGDLTVNLTISGTAISGADYVPLENPVVIPNGVSSVSLDLIAFDDLHQEPDENVIVHILPSANYNISGAGRAEVVIIDEDQNNPPAVGFSFSTSRSEENKSPGIGVSLSATSTSPITVEFVLLGGTASGGDFDLPGPPLTFEPGERAKSIPLTIVNDTNIEPNETIRIALFNPIGATLDGIKIHTYTIVDDDTASLSVTATAANATETGVLGNFRITRSGATNAALQVNFELTGTATTPADYAFLSNSVTIPAGAGFVDLPVIPINDNTVEHAETVRLTLLTAPTAKIISPNVATVTITDNDAEGLPAVAVTSTNQPYAVEGGGTGAFVFTRSGSMTGAVTIHFSVTGTAGSGEDFTALPTAITFSIGQSILMMPVSALDDDLIEGEETVILALTVTNSYRVAYPSAATVTIQDNDERVWLDASDFDAAEPGTNPGDFTFTRFGTTNTPLQVFFTLSGSAVNGVDYPTLANSFVIPAGNRSAKLSIVPLDDPLVEGPETLTLTLQGNPAYTLGIPTNATVIIMDDEPMVSIVANPTNVLEGSQQSGVFTIRRSGNPEYEFTARLAISGTATPGADYPPLLTNVFFGCGVTAIDLRVSPTNELVMEPAEIVTAALVPHPSYTILAPSNAVVIIEDAGTNLAPLVQITSPTAGIVYLLGTNVNVILEATVFDDGDTNTPLTLNWTNISGPDTFSFGTNGQPNNTVSFTNGGVYVLRLEVSEGQVTDYDEVTVVVDTLGRLSTNLLHWTFDEGNGTNVLDASGSGRDGVIVGPASWVTNGVLGGALSLNGTNNFVRELTDSALLLGRKQFSLSFWLKAEATGSARGLFTADDSGTNSTWNLSLRPTATCGASTNVIEASFVTTRGEAKRVSASNHITNDWQHIALTWSNGLAPSLFINGQLDQPGSQMVALRGFATNCPQFIIGKGAADILGSWRGLVDDVRVFPRALHPAEAGGFTATNFGAVVEVPTNITVQILTPVELSGVVTDDGRPVPPGFVSNTWVHVSGPLPITITNQHDLTNTVEFTLAGDYVFRLIADDGQVKVFQDLAVTVVEPAQISVIASDGDAAELGPDLSAFTFQRSGDLDFDMTVYVTLSGTASNGADIIRLDQTNVVTLPSGTESVVFTVTPFLDDRTEGDETLIFTIVSNVAYTIISGEATVTIHDSPYGVWNIAHFTLEELTDPTLTDLAADFDHDGRVNFVEYAANLNPKGSDTNAPLVTAIELNPTNSLTNITFTYQRRLVPTDVEYTAYVSDDLKTWNSGTNLIEEISVADDGNMLTETVKARLLAPYTTTTNTFLKLSVRLMTTGP